MFENVDLSWRLIFLKNFLNKQICWPVAAREEGWRGECFVKLRRYAKNMKVGDTMRYFMVKFRCKNGNEILRRFARKDENSLTIYFCLYSN